MHQKILVLLHFHIDEECAKLAYGVHTFNAATKLHFPLHAYRLFTLGDMVSINANWESKATMDSVHAAHCTIKGVRNVTGGETNYYIPLTLLQLTVNQLEAGTPLIYHFAHMPVLLPLEKRFRKHQPNDKPMQPLQ